MDSTFILFFVLLIALTSLVAIFFFKRKPSPSAHDAATEYTAGLNFLLAGDKDAALKKFKATVNKDSENIDAYLKIGDILRDSGQIEKAIGVHKYLTIRPGLDKRERNLILESLAKDYQTAKEYSKARELVNEVLQKDRHNSWAQKLKLKLYEEEENWENAFHTYKNLKRTNGALRNDRLALYRVQAGMQLIEQNRTKDAQSRFKDAIKIAPDSPPAYICLADSYKQENRQKEAIKVLKQFVVKVPAYSYLAFERIKDLLYERGVYGEIENFFLEVIESQPGNLMARLALAENYEKKGDVQKAIDTCLEVLNKEASNSDAKKYLVRLYNKNGDNDSAMEYALDLIDNSLKKKENFKCQHCDHESNDFFWRCQVCNHWESAVKN